MKAIYRAAVVTAALFFFACGLAGTSAVWAAHPPAAGAKPLLPSKAKADIERAKKLKAVADKGDARAVPALTAAKAQTEYRALITRIKQTLATEGRYVCCIKGGCDECALEMACPCGHEVSEGNDGDGVCETCYDGWHKGQGAYEGIAVSEVKLDKSMQDMPGMKSGQKMQAGMPNMGGPRSAGTNGGMKMGMGMTGMMGPWSMTRDGSGTSWLPDTSPMYGTMSHIGSAQTMLHGYGYGVYTDQGGPRGQEKGYVSSQIMGMAWQTLSPGAKLGVRAMLSADPNTMGTPGYPLLFQTGETAYGKPLVDRQHPHDFVMELAFNAAQPIKINKNGNLTVSGYFAPVGEPALGPTAFPHRPSAFDNPEAPLGHHWLDSTHITYGVGTVGLSTSAARLEGSIFTGREPDEHRFDWDKPRYDSYAGRLSVNPTRNLSAQISHGFLKSPEAQEPNVNEQRTTASVTYNAPIGGGQTNWQTTLAWGRKRLYEPGDPMRTTDDYLLESSYLAPRHTLFGRVEKGDKDELFPGSGSHDKYAINKFTVGGVQNVAQGRRMELGAGASVSAYTFPAALKSSYGSNPFSFNVFLRLRAARMQ